MTAGWIVAVLIEVAEEPSPQRRFFIVAQPDQGRAEWAAVDLAMQEGPVAASPSGGLEPVQAVRRLDAVTLRPAGLAPGAIRALGPRLPRRWMARAAE